MVLEMAGRPKGTPKTGGRQAGTPNKHTGEIKQMIEQALTRVGGVEYLMRQARENASAFLALVGKILPKDVNQTVDQVTTIIVETGVPTNQAEADAIRKANEEARLN